MIQVPAAAGRTIRRSWASPASANGAGRRPGAAHPAGHVPDVPKTAKVYADSAPRLPAPAIVAISRARQTGARPLEKEDNAILFIDDHSPSRARPGWGDGCRQSARRHWRAIAAVHRVHDVQRRSSPSTAIALSRRFQKIDVLEPSEAETLGDLKGLRLHYEAHHGVQFIDESLEAAVALSSRHQGPHLPDKAIDVLTRRRAQKHAR